MDEHTSQLTEYIKENLGMGHSETDIRQHLMEHNWSAAHIDEAFRALQSPAEPGNVAAQPVAEKYRVLRAIADAFRAIRYNFLAFVVSLISCLLLTFIVALLAAIPVFIVIATGGTGNSAGSLLLVFGWVLLTATAFYSIIFSFLQSCLALTMKDGINHKKSNVGELIKQSLARLVKVALANALYVVIACWPLFIISLLWFISVAVSGVRETPNMGMLVVSILLIVAATVWMIISLVRFALMPYVALFEPEVSVWKTAKRSKHLLTKGGQWFLIKGWLLIVLVSIIIGAISGETLNDLENSNDIIVNIVSIAVSILAHCVMALLYLNRRAVRD